MTEYYRITFDFGYEDDENVEEIFKTLCEKFVEFLDPHVEGNEECVRDWFMDGIAVTDEYEKIAGAIEEAVVGQLKQDMKSHEGKTVEEFFESIEFKDFPPDERYHDDE